MIPGGKQAVFIDAVKACKKYIVVEAPAGTGKTFSCIQATKAICDSGRLKSFQKVLVLTFSRNARAQLLKELSLFPVDDVIYKHIDINNYHSFFKKYLDTYRDIIGIKTTLNVVDDDDYITGLYDFANDAGISLDPDLKCTVMDDFLLENGKLTVVNGKCRVKKAKHQNVALFINTANSFTKSTGMICFAQFGGLICKLLSRFPEMAAAISHDYPILILDEYQDTNYYQELFVRSILKQSSGIFFFFFFQMIYDFRGSSVKRIEDLPRLYPDIVKIEFDEYHRYKDKTDLMQVLESIRNGLTPHYNKLVNGRLLTVSVNCNQNWRDNKNSKSQKMQCTLYATAILHNTIRIISSALGCHQSVAILCRNNIEVDRLVELFYERGFFPKEISDTKDMTIMGKHLKALIQSNTISDSISHILSLVLLCTSKKVLFGDRIESITKISFASFMRKTKDAYKKLKPIVCASADKSDYKSKVDLVKQLLYIAENEGEIINYGKRKFFLQCANLEKPSAETIDGVMLQRQYTNSFSNITPGLYITTVHQSKGKEFDCVFATDIDFLSKDRNLLYVSHSRMKNKLFPIKVNYNGLKYVN